MRTADFDYDLPPDRIAQEPAERREDARLLAVPLGGGAFVHGTIPDLVQHLRAGDLLVVNDTKVLRARLHAVRATGGRVEVFLLHPAPASGSDAATWEALVRAGGSLAEGELLTLADARRDAPGVRLVRKLGGGHWIVAPSSGTLPALMESAGRMPLPPYIRRTRDDPRALRDAERYQTVFAREPGAVAAPTAGLHLTDALLEELARRGVGRVSVTLHVGLGTFQPIAADDVGAHTMHEEPYTVPPATADAVRATRAAGGRIVAVGTTSVRALESAALASPDGLPVAGSASTRIFIAPGHTFRAVDALLTNFHLPRSTLLCLVAALAGRDRVLAAYREAVERGYRFYSYGDAMFIG